MLLQTNIFNLCDDNYKDLSKLAKAMEIPEKQVCRTREQKRQINQQFIAGAIKAFPTYHLDELFYFAPDTSDTDVSRL